MVAHRVSLATAFALTFSCWREAFAAYDVVTLRFYKAEAVPQCMEGEMIQHVPVDPDECQLSYNFSCGCVGETKVLVREQYWPKCTNQTRTIRNVTPFGECGYWGDGQDFIAEENGACPSCCQCKSDSHSNCSIFGDPHVKVFDENTNTLSLLGLSNELGAARTETEQEHLQTNNVALAPHTRKFGWGDFWLVKSDKVKIQARYRKTYYPKAKHPLNGTYLTELAVGGDFLRGSVLLLRPRQRKVIWKTKGTREEILTSLPSSFHAPLGLHHIWASYHNKTKLVKDPTKEDLGMEIELPNCVHMTVNRWKSHLDLLLSMPPGNGGIAGIDGQCGNYNQDVADDTAALIDQRIGYHIPKSERLFEDAWLAKAYDWAFWVNAGRPAYLESRLQAPDVQEVMKSLDWLVSGPLKLSKEELRRVVEAAPRVALRSSEKNFHAAKATAPPQLQEDFRSAIMADPKVLQNIVDCEGACKARCSECWRVSRYR